MNFLKQREIEREEILKDLELIYRETDNMVIVNAVSRIKRIIDNLSIHKHQFNKDSGSGTYKSRCDREERLPICANCGQPKDKHPVKFLDEFRYNCEQFTPIKQEGEGK